MVWQKLKYGLSVAAGLSIAAAVYFTGDYPKSADMVEITQGCAERCWATYVGRINWNETNYPVVNREPVYAATGPGGIYEITGYTINTNDVPGFDIGASDSADYVSNQVWRCVISPESPQLRRIATEDTVVWNKWRTFTVVASDENGTAPFAGPPAGVYEFVGAKMMHHTITFPAYLGLGVGFLPLYENVSVYYSDSQISCYTYIYTNTTYANYWLLDLGCNEGQPYSFYPWPSNMTDITDQPSQNLEGFFSLKNPNALIVRYDDNLADTNIVEWSAYEVGDNKEYVSIVPRPFNLAHAESWKGQSDVYIDGWGWVDSITPSDIDLDILRTAVVRTNDIPGYTIINTDSSLKGGGGLSWLYNEIYRAYPVSMVIDNTSDLTLYRAVSERYHMLSGPSDEWDVQSPAATNFGLHWPYGGNGATPDFDAYALQMSSYIDHQATNANGEYVGMADQQDWLDLLLTESNVWNRAQVGNYSSPLYVTSGIPPFFLVTNGPYYLFSDEVNLTENNYMIASNMEERCKVAYQLKWTLHPPEYDYKNVGPDGANFPGIPSSVDFYYPTGPVWSTNNIDDTNNVGLIIFDDQDWYDDPLLDNRDYYWWDVTSISNTTSWADTKQEVEDNYDKRTGAFYDPPGGGSSADPIYGSFNYGRYASNALVGKHWWAGAQKDVLTNFTINVNNTNFYRLGIQPTFYVYGVFIPPEQPPEEGATNAIFDNFDTSVSNFYDYAGWSVMTNGTVYWSTNDAVGVMTNTAQFGSTNFPLAWVDVPDAANPTRVRGHRIWGQRSMFFTSDLGVNLPTNYNVRIYYGRSYLSWEDAKSIASNNLVAADAQIEPDATIFNEGGLGSGNRYATYLPTLPNGLGYDTSWDMLYGTWGRYESSSFGTNMWHAWIIKSEFRYRVRDITTNLTKDVDIYVGGLTNWTDSNGATWDNNGYPIQPNVYTNAGTISMGNNHSITSTVLSLGDIGTTPTWCDEPKLGAPPNYAETFRGFAYKKHNIAGVIKWDFNYCTNSP